MSRRHGTGGGSIATYNKGTTNRQTPQPERPMSRWHGTGGGSIATYNKGTTNRQTPQPERPMSRGPKFWVL